MLYSLSVDSYDAVIVGSGPNGLAAAITLAREGARVLVLEANSTIGGGARSEELTLRDFVHDTCSAIHPLGIASPFFKSLPLQKFGLEWIHPKVPLAHPFNENHAILLYRSIDETCQQLGKDARAYQKLFKNFSAHHQELFQEILSPPFHVPKHLFLLARFGFAATRSAKEVVDTSFRERFARGLFAGLAGHSFLPLSQRPSAAIGFALAIAAHGEGWPIPKGGTQALTHALVAYLQSLGGKVQTGVRVRSEKEIPQARVVLFDLSPKQVLSIIGQHFSRSYRQSLERFRLGPGVFKMDWALSAPIPWSASQCAQAGTVHIGGTFEEIAESEQSAWSSTPSSKPFVLLAQPSLFDSTRAPAGKHTAWAYCHVPQGSAFDMSNAIEAQIEKFAPDFRKTILARKITTPKDFEANNANYIGGDISGGVPDLWQFLFRPVLRWNPYTTPLPNYFICSASTPPGAGVHGMCGYWAAQSALKQM